ncbi:hypothetical protein A2917_01070 [Candidatus Nomurabacteria bacterium RIFCSPLOWO2_01_FULL_42_17]|uniref:DUF2914 domain-containing protein n=1 Tax=Candidatus Nomurabacteria bacterium RIFCSPLOWO2_01_FULL_42_17 TaxID=1801780 RepID=A0A1F6XM90_9BACT|nr:MAG: hypothetical protein A2917_01070 [Candidatus Nomurabacteria bacterium RIFCSPLOWO2_01_FULL_42_17]
MRMLKPVTNFYTRFEHPISSLFLIFGFVFDALTLKRVDTLWENLWIVSYLIIIGAFIAFIHIREDKSGGEKNLTKAHFWSVNILQFAFGGVFSAYLVLYFRSADIMVAWPFIALLATIFIANEFFKKHYVRLGLQISLYFLAIYSFMIFLMPVILHKIGSWIFLLSGLLSLLLITLFIKVLFRFTKDKFAKSKRLVIFLISSIFILVNLLYFLNLIPPIPLSLKDVGMYHTVHKTEHGYVIIDEEHSWKDYFNLYPDFNKTPNSSIYAFSAVFSPKNLDITILHEWQRYDEKGEKWITESIIHLPVIGGRDRGFRTYSKRSNLAAGKWRVNVKTEEGKLIGRMRFTIVLVDTNPPLKILIK